MNPAWAHAFAPLHQEKSHSERGVALAWLTGDVHYAAAHYYDPAQARFQDFDGFWEFVAGPLHASSYGAKELDDTFGPRVVFCAEGGSLLDRYSA